MLLAMGLRGGGGQASDGGGESVPLAREGLGGGSIAGAGRRICRERRR